jgi:hypothetical protein
MNDIIKQILSISDEIQKSSRKGFANYLMVNNEAAKILDNLLNEDEMEKYNEVV